MLLSELLLTENRADFIISKLGPKLVQKAHANGEGYDSPQAIIQQLTQGDPTRNKQYLQWLANQYLKGQFRLEDMSRVASELNQFIQVKNKLETSDINRYDYYQLSDQLDKVFNRVQLANDDQLGTDIKVLYKGPLGLLAVPLTQQASCQLGAGTKWCTAGKEDNKFDFYNQKGPLYIWKDKSGQKYQFHFETSQFMDAQDRPINRKLLTEFRLNHPVLSKLFKKWEEQIVGDPWKACQYAADVIKGRWPEAEPYIMKDPECAYAYAADVIKGRWPEAEPYIMKSVYFAYSYAKDVIEGRWPEAEPVIMKDPKWAFMYAKYVIKGRWREAELHMMKDPSQAYQYEVWNPRKVTKD